MKPDTKDLNNVKKAVPFLRVTDLGTSTHFYIDGLGFEMTKKWIDEGKLRWCWLELGSAALMLQEFKTEGHDSWTPEGKLGEGVSIVFICKDALAVYRHVRSRGLRASRPVVSNNMWNFGLDDPDGYRLEFESDTDAPEGTPYKEEERS